VAGTVSAVVAGIVKSARTILSVFALLLAMTATATVPSFAAPSHPICATKQHDCGRATTITNCCCGDKPASQVQSTPVETRVEVRADLSPVPAIMQAVLVATSSNSPIRIHTSPPHRYLVDLPTLFSTLLI
jgi:hypothetical protein